MAKNVRAIEEKISLDERNYADAKTGRMIAEMALGDVRRAMGITQERLAETLRSNQGRVSDIENSSDVLLSTLRKVIEAMGGELEIRAKFPSGEVKINQVRKLVRRVRLRGNDQSEALGIRGSRS